MTIKPSFPPIVLTGNDIDDIGMLLKKGNIVALCSSTICKIFHSIPFIEKQAKPLANTRVIYINCEALDMSHFDRVALDFGENIIELQGAPRLEKRILEEITIPHKVFITLD